MVAARSSLFWTNWSRQESKLIPVGIYIRIVCVNDIIKVLHKHSLPTFNFPPTEQANTSPQRCDLQLCGAAPEPCTVEQPGLGISMTVMALLSHIANGTFPFTPPVINYVNNIQLHVSAHCFKLPSGPSCTAVHDAILDTYMPFRCKA